MAEKRDYYEVLGVDRSVSADELKKAYRRKARELHPDVNRTDPHAEEHFKELGEAYEVLSDAQKRAAYDHYGHAGVNGMGGAGGAGYDTFGFGDLFESFFGGMGQTGRPDPRGSDLRYDIEITLEEAADGAERTIRYPHHTVCGACKGVGSETGIATPCRACRGTGQRRQVSNNFLGMQFTTMAPCDECGATGEVIANPCRQCNGQGRARTTEELLVKIPAGADTGLHIRHRGKGDVGIRGAQGGDLLVAIHLQEHPVFQRRGADLLCEAKLPFSIAALGGKLQAPGLHGTTEVDVPAGTQTGHTFRLRGQGMPHLDGTHRGDQYVVVTVQVPTDLNGRQRELLREFAKERGENIDHKKSVFQKVKEAVEEVVDGYRDGKETPAG